MQRAATATATRVSANRRHRARIFAGQIAAAGTAPRFWGFGPVESIAIMNPMLVFYWVMGVLIAGTFVPSVLYLGLYAATGEPACADRARVLWNVSRVFALFGFNILVWGHVVVGLWNIWFR